MNSPSTPHPTDPDHGGRSKATETPLTAQASLLLDWFEQQAGAIVAFSAGVDSTLVAAAAVRALGSRALAVTAVSPSLASGELDQARELAGLIGITHREVNTQEFSTANYTANAPDRCFHCKTELYGHLVQLQHAEPAWQTATLVNGANVDDQGDYRPGMQAAAAARVRSPLIECGFTKAAVRRLSRQWNLPVWDKPAMPCLSSRVAYGVEVTLDRVRRIDAAERFLKTLLEIDELRVRLEENELARIELPITAIEQLARADVRMQVTQELKSLGFRYITLDLEGFRSGSLNAVIPSESLRMFEN